MLYKKKLKYIFIIKIRYILHCEPNSSNNQERTKMMKKMVLMFAMLIVSIAMAKDVVVTDTLLNALVEVESGGNSNKIGKLGEIGILQIRPIVIEDVNRIYKTKYKFLDAKNNTKAREICRLYLKYWGSKYQKKTGKIADNEVLSKIWNGGPNGPFKRTTYVITQLNQYWAKVKRVLT